MPPVEWAIYVASRRAGRCPRCNDPVVFAQSADTGRVSPFNPPLTTIGRPGLIVEIVDLAALHWATCTGRPRHSEPPARQPWTLLKHEEVRSGDDDD